MNEYHFSGFIFWNVIGVGMFMTLSVVSLLLSYEIRWFGSTETMLCNYFQFTEMTDTFHESSIMN